MMQEYTLGVARWPERAALERGMTLAEYLAWEREKNQRAQEKNQQATEKAQ